MANTCRQTGMRRRCTSQADAALRRRVEALEAQVRELARARSRAAGITREILQEMGVEGTGAAPTDAEGVEAGRRLVSELFAEMTVDDMLAID